MRGVSCLKFSLWGHGSRVAGTPSLSSGAGCGCGGVPKRPPKVVNYGLVKLLGSKPD